MLDGTIHSIATDKGYGFIQPRLSGPDIFFHRSAVEGAFESLTPGQEVTYALDASSEKPRASSVKAGQAKRPFSRNQPRRSGPSMPPPARPVENCEFGYVTKLRRRQLQGSISSVQHGPELVFDASSVTGDKRYSRLEVGDYVRFVRVDNPEDPKQPVAKSVMAVERKIKTPRLNLPKHRRARGKKPTWR